MYYPEYYNSTHDENKLAELEEKEVLDFVKKNPFPTHKEIIIDLINRGLEKNPYNYFYKHYDDKIHNLLKTIYDNGIFDERVNKIVGNLIYEISNDTNFLRFCYYLFFHHSPLAKSKSVPVRTSSKILEFHWDGIGNWIS